MRKMLYTERILQVDHRSNTCVLEDGTVWKPPSILAQFVCSSDRLMHMSDSDMVVIERLGPHGRLAQHLYIRIKSWSNPIRTQAGEHILRGTARNPTPTLILSAACLATYFYGVEELTTLYEAVDARPDADAADLRNRWRLRDLELTSGAAYSQRLRAERAFNILMNPRLRSSYDAMLTGCDVPLPLPYAGPAEVLVEGKMSAVGDAFFGKYIVAYRPEMEKRTVSVLLRACEFLEDRVICREPRNRLEIWLDRTQLPGISWDLTWNHAKRWLHSRLTVDATFVRTRAAYGEVRLIALPSRTMVTLPEEISAEVSHAAAVQRSVGQNIEVLDYIRAELQRAPIEHIAVQRWLDHLGVADAGPELAIWESGYDAFYFQTLREHSLAWFLYRNEFLFLLPHALVVEIPKTGHATYAFAKPADLGSFLRRYSLTTRDDVRANRNNAATDLGFIGRIVRGTEKARWARSVLKVGCGASGGF